MQVKQQDSQQQQSQCDSCKSTKNWLLHNVRHRGTYRQFCTNCLLKNHQGLFCPFCLVVYEEPLRPHERLTCFKCPSISHLSCTNPISPSSPSSFLCPSCSNSSFSFFKTGKVEKESALALVAAAKIAAASMNRAAALAKVEAERRVKEASFAKKKAREALERLAYLVKREEEMKEKEMERNVSGNGQVEDVKGVGNGVANGFQR